MNFAFILSVLFLSLPVLSFSCHLRPSSSISRSIIKFFGPFSSTAPHVFKNSCWRLTLTSVSMRRHLGCRCDGGHCTPTAPPLHPPMHPPPVFVHTDGAVGVCDKHHGTAQFKSHLYIPQYKTQVARTRDLWSYSPCASPPLRWRCSQVFSNMAEVLATRRLLRSATF